MKPALLGIVEAGGYPDLSPIYTRCGFESTVVYSDRKAFALCRKLKPQVVVAEFKYGPVYGSRLSNMESLIAVMQINCPDVKLIVLFDEEDRPHFERLTKSFPVFGSLAFPLDQSVLEDMLQSIQSSIKDTENHQ